MSKVNLSAEAKAWILYDGGNSAFATTVIAAFFPIFFNDFWASGLEAEVKTAYLGWGLTISNLVLLFTSPSVSYTHLRAHETREDLVCRRVG